MKLKFLSDLQKNNRLDNLTLFLIVAGIIVFLNLVCTRVFVRLDLTGDRIYSLSSSSKKVVRELHEPMTVKVFFTRDLPAPYSTYYKYLEDILREYRSSGWKFRYEFVDLKRKPTAPDEYGIQPVQLQVYEKDQVQFKRAHIGMVFIHGDVIERIPQITSTEGLEYKITSIIRKMNNKVDKLANLKGNVEIVLFASSNIPLPDIQSVEGKVKEKFDSLNKKYLGKLKYSSVDTARNPESEKVAREYGMRAVSWPAMRGTPAGSGYIGVVVVFGDKREGLNLLGQNMFGQYYIDGIETIDATLSGVIDNLIGLNRKIGYITGYGEPNRFGGYGGMMGGRGGDEQNTISHLAGFIDAEYQFESIAVKDKKISSDVSALLVIGPKQRLDEYALFQIDQFIMSGKPVAFLLSGLDFPQPPPELAMYQQQPPQGSAVNTGLEYLLAAYGVKLNNNVVFDENCYKQQTPREYGGGERAIYFAPIIEQENISQKHPVTQKIKGMVALQASSIEPIDSVIKANKLSYLELIKTSKRSWQQGEGAMLQYAMPPQGTNDFRKHTISAVVEGAVKSYFDGKPIPRGATNASTAGIGLAASSDAGFIPAAKKARIFILAGSEMAKNSIIDQEGKYPNSIFVKNLIDWLAADQDLIPIRKKGLSYNPMKKVPDFVKTLIKFINVGGVPLIVIVLGIFLWRLDNARRDRIRAQFK